MKLVISLLTNTIVGSIEGVSEILPNTVYLDPPEDFDMSSASEWSYDGVSVSRDPVAALDRAKAARKVRIKADATRLIDATTWRLERAREQESAGWASLVSIDAVLAERESIRRSSSAAESVVDAMTDIASIQNFSWSISVTVPVPRRVTHKQFMDRFSDAEIGAILSAAGTNSPMQTWWKKFELAGDINLDDVITITGMQALEISGILAAGRSAVILA